MVDAGSTDGTLDVLREFDDDERFSWTSEPDTGQSNAINKGWRRSHGQVLSWLCADDGLYPGAVAEVVRQFRRHPDGRPRLRAWHRGRSRPERDAHDAARGARRPHTRRSRELHLSARCVRIARSHRSRRLRRRVPRLRDGLGPVHPRRENPADRPHPAVLAWARDYAETKTRSGGRPRFHEVLGVLRKHSDRRYPPAYFLHRALELRRVAARIRRSDAGGPRSRRAPLPPAHRPHDGAGHALDRPAHRCEPRLVPGWLGGAGGRVDVPRARSHAARPWHGPGRVPAAARIRRSRSCPTASR